MSLINNVLNKLERKRHSYTGQRAPETACITPTINKQEGLTKWKLVYWIAILIIIVLGVISIHYHTKFLTGLSHNFISLTKNLKKKIPHKHQDLVSTKTPTVKLNDVLLIQEGNKTVIDFILSAPTSYNIEYGSEQQLLVTLNNTGVLGNIPISLGNSSIVSLNTTQNNTNIVSTLNLIPGTKVDVFRLIEKPIVSLHLVLSNSQLNKTAVSKVPTPLSPEEEMVERYREIQQALAQHNNQGAIQKLYLFVGDFPNNNEARSLLASLLIKEGRIPKADDVLVVGLNKSANYLPFIKLKARILIEQDKLADATELLQKNDSADSFEDIEYLAILASLYQRQGAFIKAAKLYSQLTKIQPQETKWWLGLGVNLEYAGKKNAANEAYRRAYNLANVGS